MITDITDDVGGVLRACQTGASSKDSVFKLCEWAKASRWRLCACRAAIAACTHAVCSSSWLLRAFGGNGGVRAVGVTIIGCAYGHVYKWARECLDEQMPEFCVSCSRTGNAFLPHTGINNR